MRRAFAAALALAALAGCGGDSGAEYGATFQSPSGVEQGDEVVVRGDEVEFRVEDAGPRLYRDAGLVARGDQVALMPGSATAPPLLEGQILPMAQTASERRR